MPRAVDPPGLFPAADLDPNSKNLYLDWTTFPKFRWLDWLEIEMLKQCFQNMINGFLTIQWFPLIAQGVRQAIAVAAQFVVCLAYWAMKVVENLTKIGRDKYGWMFAAVFANFEMPMLVSVLSTFWNTWMGIAWLQQPIRSLVTAWSAAVQLVQGVVRWFLKVIDNILGIRAPGWFELEMLRQAWTDFTTRWNAINWLNLLALPANLRAAVSAIVTLAGDLVNWAIKVFQNLTGIDMRQLLSALALPQLRAVIQALIDTLQAINWLNVLQTPQNLQTALTAVIDFAKGIVDWGLTVFNNFGLNLRNLFSAFMLPDLRALLASVSDTLRGINWLSAGAVMAAIGAADSLIRGIGNWLLSVLQNFFGSGIDTIRSMFSSLTSFIDHLVQFFMGNDALAGWRAALDLLAGITGASPLQAIMGVYDKLRDLLSTNIGDLISQIQNVLGGNIGDLIQNAISGIMLPIGNLTGEQPNLLATHGHFPSQSTIAENPWWIWDSAVTATPDGSGSARIDANATLRALRSIPLAVAPGTQVSAAISLRWQNLSYTATAPMRLQVIDYSSGTERPAVTVADVGTPAANSDWLTIAASWIVPNDVEQIRMRLVVADTCLAGRIWWDNGVFKRSGGILQEWVNGLQQAMQQAADFVNSIIDNLWQGLTGLPGIGKTINDLRAAAEQIAARISGIIDNLWQGLTGLPGIGKTLADLRAAAEQIAGRINGIIDNLWAAFTGITGQVGKTLEDLRVAVVNQIAGINTRISDIIDRLWAAFNGVAVQAGKTINDLLTAAQGLKTNVESRLNATSQLNAANLINLFTLNRNTVPDLGTAVTALINDGTGGVMTRRGTGNVSLSSNVGGVVLNSFFDRIDAAPAGITAALATSRFTVTTAGLYRCDVCFKIQPTVSAIWAIAPVLFKNGAVYRVGADGIAFNYLTVGISVRWIKSSFEVRLLTNDYVQAGYQGQNATGTISSVLTGEANGAECYFTTSLVSADIA